MAKIDVNQIVEEAENYLKSLLPDLIEGKISEIKIPFLRPGSIISVLESEGFRYEHAFDTNGWEWDYWAKLSKDGKEFTLSGDGYYRNTATLQIYQ